MSGEAFYKPHVRVMGGCGDCNAVQEMREAEPGVWVLEVRHDPTCPTYRRIVARRNGVA
ncbi:hypothetical protein [Demequina lutea]|uniref:Uncharacterized protein n=1 Tax=Demequina lutea TaxID=431489 RepID=A0A7Y9ZCD8_9MICO|nr:hypothetical protein [Demequina lutea]NYI42048.1 hypothetical protein [Demequina lutea]